MRYTHPHIADPQRSLLQGQRGSTLSSVVERLPRTAITGSRRVRIELNMIALGSLLCISVINHNLVGLKVLQECECLR